ncbi:hypothetical protein BD560DRAFT_426534 [Blakeslea trispora]|nr:hypothetical protein BD560DRAFT_426534 [Blakeslea trispora]
MFNIRDPWEDYGLGNKYDIQNEKAMEFELETNNVMYPVECIPDYDNYTNLKPFKKPVNERTKASAVPTQVAERSELSGKSGITKSRFSQPFKGKCNITFEQARPELVERNSPLRKLKRARITTTLGIISPLDVVIISDGHAFYRPKVSNWKVFGLSDFAHFYNSAFWAFDCIEYLIRYDR